MNPWARFATVMVSAAAIGVAWVAVDATLLVDEEAVITIATPEPTAPTAEPMPHGEEFITTWTGLRVQLPLIPNGEYDFFFPKETSQRPLFDLLGTPAQHKRWEVYAGGHSVPRNTMIEQTLSWMDQYLGPVE